MDSVYSWRIIPLHESSRYILDSPDGTSDISPFPVTENSPVFPSTVNTFVVFINSPFILSLSDLSYAKHSCGMGFSSTWCSFIKSTLSDLDPSHPTSKLPSPLERFIISARNFMNRLPWSSFVKWSANIDSVGQCFTMMLPFLMWYFMK